MKRWASRAFRPAFLLAGALLVMLLASGGLAAPAGAQALNDDELPPPSLKVLPVPEPPGLTQYVRDKQAAIRLGKALFWDMQVGSDGIQACASCHSHAGADNRSKNQLSPGLLVAGDPDGNGVSGDQSFQAAGVNSKLTRADFPLHERANPHDQNSPVVRNSNDAVSSQGIWLAQYAGFVPGSPVELRSTLGDPVFSSGSNVRRVAPRNTPTVLNAVFGFQNFWDGRAQATFNGKNPLGVADQNAAILVRQPDGTLALEKLRLKNAALASQATGPPLSSMEMSFAGRTWHDIGRKMLTLRPLGKQLVHPEDSVLGGQSRAVLVLGQVSGLPGLSTSYGDMIKQAFQPNLWDAGQTQIVDNFSFFFGLAVQLYEATLVSDDSRYDQVQEGRATFTAQEQEGLDIFFNQGECFNCHKGPLFTNAARSTFPDEFPIEFMKTMEGAGFYDSGFYNVGVTSFSEDIGRGGYFPQGYPLAYSKQGFVLNTLPAEMAEGLPDLTKDGFVNGVFVIAGWPPAVDATFKAPTLRNIELTGPYFHNGGAATLEQAVDLYVRGGNFREDNISTLSIFVKPIGHVVGHEDRRDALVAFLKTLTDERVRWEKAPFDHPQLFIPNGHPMSRGTVLDANGDGLADDELLQLPPIGQRGRAPEFLPTLKRFLHPGMRSRAGWNLVAGGPGFDTGGRLVFGFDGSSYRSMQAAATEAGQGYWVNTPSPSPIDLSDSRAPLQVHLTVGWNLIGNSSEVPVALPVGMVAFGFDGGFASTTTLQPGQGAWLRATVEQDIELAPAGS